jgi:pimeloyl-ACP methyl ester carboxylesterase
MKVSPLPRLIIALCLLCVAAAARAEEKPFVLHLPGVGGHLVIDDAMVQGLSRDRDVEVEIYDWTEGDAGLNALLGAPRHRKQAKLVSERIAEIARKSPGRTIHVIAHSGGTGIAVWALESLPGDVTIESLTLLASALSPSYDLSPALQHVQRAYAFSSRFDSIVLGRGTLLLGTIDGIRSESAGLVGFLMPDKGDANLYAKLMQFEHQPAWARYGNDGDHIGTMRRRFAAAVLAPLVFEGVVPGAGPATQPTTKPANE